MEIKPFFSVLIVLALLAVLGVFVYRGLGPSIPGQGLPEEGLPEQGLPEQGPRMGMLQLYLCDAPLDAENVTGVYVTINEIQYHGEAQWATCQDFVGPQTYDLLELTGGKSALLGELALPAGNYTQIRFMLDIEEEGASPASPGCYLEFADNSTKPLFAPSGGRTGYKGVGHFEVPVNGTVEVTADFDASKAVVVAGSKYILKPTIKLIVSH
jgi:hypothetical protein